MTDPLKALRDLYNATNCMLSLYAHDDLQFRAKTRLMEAMHAANVVLHGEHTLEVPE